MQTQHLKPTEFEALAGRGTAKKWKASLRISGGPSADMTVGGYLARVHKVCWRHPACTCFGSFLHVRGQSDVLVTMAAKCTAVRAAYSRWQVACS